MVMKTIPLHKMQRLYNIIKGVRNRPYAKRSCSEKYLRNKKHSKVWIINEECIFCQAFGTIYEVDGRAETKKRRKLPDVNKGGANIYEILTVAHLSRWDTEEAIERELNMWHGSNETQCKAVVTHRLPVINVVDFPVEEGC